MSRALLVLPFFCCSSFAQHLIQGTVQDQSGAAVRGAHVRTSHAQAVTDEQGNFSLQLASDDRQLRVSAEGFKPAALNVSPGSGQVTITLLLPNYAEQIVVAASSAAQEREDSIATVETLTTQQLSQSAATTLDAKLQQVPGFTFFRRQDARAVNPTAQGVSLRGIGSSGASRTLVLEDGVPLEDAFGGWVYFDQLPQTAIDRVEVVQGGVSDIYGSGAMAGVVALGLKRNEEQAATIDLAAGNLGQLSGDGGLSSGWKSFNFGVFASGFQNDGYIPVLPPQRGSVDRPVNLRYGSSLLRIGKTFRKGDVFGAFQVLDDARSNGTREQFNNVRLWTAFAGADLETGRGILRSRVFGEAEAYNQTFSAIADGRNSETFLRSQHVPAQREGGSVQWAKSTHANTIAAGFDVSQVRGRSQEQAFAQFRPTTLSSAGGHQQRFGIFVQDRITVLSKLDVTGGLRYDHRGDSDAVSATATPGKPAAILRLPNRTAGPVSPRAGLLYRLSPHIHLTASGYRAFRAPTLNELYRGFRLGNIQTNANPLLKSERLTGAEGGVDFIFGNSFIRANYFFFDLTDPIANVTLTTTPALITRQRQNLGRTHIAGLEMEAAAGLTRAISLRGGLEYTPAKVVAFPVDPTLVGKYVPEVAKLSASAGVFYAGSHWTASAQVRARSGQYDDDRNQFYLGPFGSVDLFLSRRLVRGAEAYAAVENLSDVRYGLAATPVITVSAPRTIRVGLRWNLSRK